MDSFLWFGNSFFPLFRFCDPDIFLLHTSVNYFIFLIHIRNTLF